MAGSVSGGCVEAATAGEISAALERGTPRLVTFGVSDEQAWEVGLACGGTIKVFVEPTIRPEVLAAARGPGGEVVATVVEGAMPGRSARMFDDGRMVGDLGPGITGDTVRDAAMAALRRESSTTLALETPAGAASVFLEVFPRHPRLVVFGGVHVAVALVPLAKMLGYRSIVADGRASFLTRDRFPEADDLILAWPEQAFERIGLDRACYVCILSHDPKFDEPALKAASAILPSVSASKEKFNLWSAMNFLWLSASSKLTPITSALSFLNASIWSRKPQASLVQPGVLSLG
jgi:xanthine dehydrogenase accessory factor